MKELGYRRPRDFVSLGLQLSLQSF